MFGSWDYSEVTAEGLPQQVETGFETITQSGLVGASFTPVKYLGKQIANGTNYAVLAKAAPVVPNAPSHLVVIIFNQQGDIANAVYKLIKIEDFSF